MRKWEAIRLESIATAWPPASSIRHREMFGAGPDLVFLDQKVERTFPSWPYDGDAIAVKRLGHVVRGERHRRLAQFPANASDREVAASHLNVPGDLKVGPLGGVLNAPGDFKVGALGPDDRGPGTLHAPFERARAGSHHSGSGGHHSAAIGIEHYRLDIIANVVGGLLQRPIGPADMILAISCLIPARRSSA
jgi:hypothetical protein